MVRKVFDNHMTAHVWAQQEQDSGRSNNGNFWFEGATIWSYRTPIARFVTDVHGRRVLLRTSETFSVTTSGKHERAIDSAIRGHSYDAFCVPKLGGSTWGNHNESEVPHADNLAWYLKGARDTLAKWSRIPVTSWRAEVPTYEPEEGCESAPRFIQDSAATFRRAALYAECFGLPIDFDGPAEVAAMLASWNARVAKYNSPEAATKREKDKAARERAAERKAERERVAAYENMKERLAAWRADSNYSRPHSYQFPGGSPERAEMESFEAAEKAKQIEDSKRLFGLWKAGKAERPNAWRYGSASDTENPLREMAQAIAADEARENFERETAERAAWLRGDSARWYGTDEAGGALLRVRGDTDAIRAQVSLGALDGLNVETSQGASVPLAHAVKAFRFIKLTAERREAWQRNGKTIRVGHFQVDKIEPNGDIRAGCHFIRFAELSRLAESIGLADIAADDSASKRARHR